MHDKLDNTVDLLLSPTGWLINPNHIDKDLELRLEEIQGFAFV